MDRVLTENGPSKISVQGIREVTTAATTIVGSVKNIGFGKEIVYCQLASFSSANTITKGMLVRGKACVAHHQNVTAAATASVGDKFLSLTIGATSCAKDFYKNGILFMNTSANSYMIKSNDSAAASGTLNLYLKDGLEVAVAAQTCVAIPNPYYGVTTKEDCAVTTAIPAGVTLASAVYTGGQYCYLGKKGIWPVKLSGTLIVGNDVTLGSAAGTVMPRATTETAIGRVVATGASTFGLVDFNL